jgi:hypothetical protein
MMGLVEDRDEEIRRKRRQVVERDPESGLDIYTAPLRIGHLDEPGGGWISPEGKFYRCPDVCHLELARRLCLDFGWIKVRTRRRVNLADTRLDRAGWARIWDNGLMLTDYRRLTQAQLDIIFDLAQQHPSMRENLMHILTLRRKAEGDGG